MKKILFILLMTIIGLTVKAVNATVYVQADEAPYLYGWFTIGAKETKINGAWPGKQLTQSVKKTNKAGEEIEFWYITFDFPETSSFNIIFNNGNTAVMQQTGNISDIASDRYFTYDGKTKYTDITEDFGVEIPDVEIQSVALISELNSWNGMAQLFTEVEKNAKYTYYLHLTEEQLLEIEYYYTFKFLVNSSAYLDWNTEGLTRNDPNNWLEEATGLGGSTIGIAFDEIETRTLLFTLTFAGGKDIFQGWTLTVTDGTAIDTEQTINDVTYYLNNDDMTAMVYRIEGERELYDIPEKILDDKYTVASIADSVFKNCNHTYAVSFPATITTISDKAFSQYGASAIIWNSDVKLLDRNFTNEEYKLGNFLLFVNSDGVAPGNVKNVIVNGVARNNIVLEEGHNFFNPTSFMSPKISYTHNYQMETGYFECAGWETIALPFDVQTITHETKGELVPFAAWDRGLGKKPFWLFAPSEAPTSDSGMSTGGGWTNYDFVPMFSIKANTPYIISFPNNSNYSPQYILNGKVTFEASNVTVESTTGSLNSSMLSSSFSGGNGWEPSSYWIIPNFTYQSGPDYYALNVTNDYFNNTDDKDKPGSVFIKSSRSIAPFEAYCEYYSKTIIGPIIDPIIDPMFDPIEIESRRIYITFAENDLAGIRDLTIENDNKLSFNIYDIKGKLIRVTNDTPCVEVTNGLPAGIYIINGKKVIVR